MPKLSVRSIPADTEFEAEGDVGDERPNMPLLRPIIPATTNSTVTMLTAGNNIEREPFCLLGLCRICDSNGVDDTGEGVDLNTGMDVGVGFGDDGVI